MGNDIQIKSRTQVKKEAEELQKLGEELIKLPSHQLKRMGLPDNLLDALLEAKSIKSNIAGRRQRQFIGTLMRDVDSEPIRHALLQTDAELHIESEIVKETQVWLERLLTDDSAILEEFLCTCPGLSRQRLKQLLRNIKKEKTTGKSSKSIKAIEQLIRKSINNK